MRMTLAEVLQHQNRVMVRHPKPEVHEGFSPATRETGKGGLHEQIMAHCDAQWPRWKYIHARTDQKSTIAVGVHDFTIYLPAGRVFSVECKAKGGKLSNHQLAWMKELEMLGHVVHVVDGYDLFLKLVNSKTPAK